jgi:hypothetical protein
MAVNSIPTYKPSTNAKILNAIRADASPAYQSRIPNVTKANIQKSIETLMEIPVLRNEFIDALVNKIGLTIFRSKIWRNPLQTFKIDPLTWGAVIEEVQVGLLEAKVYDPDREYMEKEIFGRELPPVATAYHKINRANYYKISIREELLRRAFLSDFGLSTMVTNLMNSLYNSANWDEFLLITGLIPEYAKQGGFFKVHVDAVTTEATAKTLLKSIRSHSALLEYPSTHYNAARMPTWADPDDLVLLISPEAKAELDVEAFAAAFNIPFTDIPARVITIPKQHFGIDGVQAILTTKDLWVIADTLMENREIANPASLDRNYFFHIHQILSMSLFIPAIMFWTGAGDVIETTDLDVTGISEITATYSQDGTVIDAGDPLTRGELYILSAEAVTAPADGVNNGVKWAVTGQNTTGTYVSQTGNLNISIYETADEITVTATTSYIDPEGVEVDGEETTRTFALTGDRLASWPSQGLIADTVAP